MSVCVKFFDASLCIKFRPLNISIRLLVLNLLLTLTRAQWGPIIGSKSNRIHPHGRSENLRFTIAGDSNFVDSKKI